MSAIKTRILDGFDDPTFGPEQWNDLLRKGDTDVFCLTWHWQRAWWESFGSDQLLLILAEKDRQAVALAPFYIDFIRDEGMIFFLGSGHSDYLDFIGDISDPEVLDAILHTARDRVPNFWGFEFHLVSDSSRTGKRLEEAASRLALEFDHKEDLPAHMLDLAGQPGVAVTATNKKSLLRHERFFRREGLLDVRHLQDGDAILPHLEEFFEQHIARWAGTRTPSNFNRPYRAFIERLVRLAADTGWLRFTRVDWRDRPIAFHFGFCYRRRYSWYKPSFAIDLARRSPGEVLLRQLLVAAIEEGASTFDFGLGDEEFKLRFATHVNHVRSWGLYPTPPIALPIGEPHYELRCSDQCSTSAVDN